MWPPSAPAAHNHSAQGAATSATTSVSPHTAWPAALGGKIDVASPAMPTLTPGATRNCTDKRAQLGAQSDCAAWNRQISGRHTHQQLGERMQVVNLDD